jgi:hypothetical protein
VTGEISELDHAINGMKLKLNAPAGIEIEIQTEAGDLLSQIAAGMELKAAQQTAEEAATELRSPGLGAVDCDPSGH